MHSENAYLKNSKYALEMDASALAARCRVVANKYEELVQLSTGVQSDVLVVAENLQDIYRIFTVNLQ